MLSTLMLVMLFALLPSFSNTFTVQRHNSSIKKPRNGANSVPWTLEQAQAQLICKKPLDQQCNVHLPNFQCACPTTTTTTTAAAAIGDEQSAETAGNSCQTILPAVENPNEQLLTIGVSFPLLEPFMDEPEQVFLEDLEIFTFIPRESIVVYARGCAADRSAYEFQIGILDTASSQAEEQQSMPQLRTLSPRIFLSNKYFMEENALKIGYVRAGGM